MSAESDALREYFESQLRQLREQNRANRNDNFLLHLVSLEATVKQGVDEAIARHEENMKRTKNMVASTATRLEKASLAILREAEKTAAMLVSNFIRDCAPPGFTFVPEE